jgi:DNA polymerase phi
MKQLPENFAAVNALQRHNVHVLARPLRGSSGCYPRVHSAWFGVFGHVLSPTEAAKAALDGELFQEAWTVLVENSLIGGNGDDAAPTSHERQGLALKLFELVAPKIPAPVLRAILTPRFVKCLYNNAVAKRNYLHEAARHCLKSFAACAPAEFFHFFRKQFAAPLSILVTSTSADSEDEEEDEKPTKKQKLSNGGFDALVELEEKKEREEAVQRRTDRARVWAIETMVAALTELLSAKSATDAESAKLQDDMLRFLVFHSFYTPSGDAESTPSKKNKKAKKSKTSEADQVVQEAAEATPALSENVASYAKTRLFSLLSLGLAGAEGARASASVLSRIFAIAQDMQASSAAVALREPLDEEAAAQFTALAGHVDTLRNKEAEQDGEDKKSAARRPLSETFLLLFMSAGLQLLDGEQREDAAVVAADLDKCYAELVAKKATPAKKKSKKSKKKEAEAGETEEDSVVVLTDLLLSLLSQDSSALREIVTQVFRSLLPLLNAASLTTMVNVLHPSSEGEGAANDDEDDEFAPITHEDEEEDDEEENGEEEEVTLSSADAVSDALRSDEKMSALHQEDLALAAIVGQVKVRSQRKKDLKRARLQTMHFQLRVLDLLQVFVSQRPEEAATAAHSALVLSLVAPLFRVLARVQHADSEKLVLRDRLQAVLLHKVLRAKDKLPSTEAAQTEALAALREIVELVRTTPMEKEHAGKVASAAVVYLVRVICTGEASSDEQVQKIVRASALDAFTKKHSRFPRAAFEELLTKSPAVGARVLLEPLAAIAAAEEKEGADETDVPAAVDEFSKCEVFRLLTLLLRGAGKLQQGGELSAAQRSAFKHTQTSLKSALVRQLAPESVQQLKAKRMKVVLMFALQLVKFWRAAADKTATEADVRAVAAAVQAVASKSPVVKGMVKQVSEAAGVPFVAVDGAKAAKKTPKTEDEDELMPEPKAKKSKAKSPKDKQKKKRKRVAAE